MRQFLITIGGVVTGMLLCAIIIPLVLIGLLSSVLKPERPSLPSDIVIELDLTTPMSERPARGLAALDPDMRSVSIFDLVRGLERAASDERVKGVLIRIGEGAVTPAQAEEVHEALKPIYEAKKFVLAWAVSFNGPTLADYDAATAASEIWMQPSGVFMPAGFALETFFLKDLMDKVGAKGDFIALHEYKSAADIFTRTDFSDPDRQQLSRLLATMHDAAIKRIATARKLSPQSLAVALEKSPQSSKSAKQLKLVDRLGYDDELRQDIRKRAGSDATFVSLPKYVAGLSEDNGTDKIAVVFGEGMVVEGDTEDTSLFASEAMMGGDTLSEAFRKAAEDEKVKAIVFRVNSPGGSATASDQIWRAVGQARQSGKPVIVSMGDVAASGGYYVAVAGDYILADAATITGSIGVVGGKVVIADLLGKIGVRVGRLARNENTLMWQGTNAFTPQQRTQLNRILSDTYDDFAARVAQGRRMTLAQVDSVARGRVWSGVDARTHGLIDKQGGLAEAIMMARERGGVPKDAKVKLVIYPDTPSFLDQLFDTTDDFEDVKATINVLSRLEGSSFSKLISEAGAEKTSGGLLRAPSLNVQ